MLYGVSPIGLGHASRSAAIGIKLRERSIEPVFATGGPATPFLRSYGFTVHDIVREPVPSESGGEMKMVALWYLRYWLAYRSTSGRMARLIERLRPRLIVGDEEFSCVSLALDNGIRHAMISDELELGFAKGAISRRLEGKVAEWYSQLQRKVSHLLIPSFGEDRGNVHFMTPVVREPTKTRKQVREEHDIADDARLILFSSSGTGIGRFLLERSLRAFRKVRSKADVFAVAGSTRLGQDLDGVLNLGVVRDNQDLIGAADLVISTAGKSTIDEALSFGTPMIAIPIRNHAEQERNASELGFSSDDIDRLDELIPANLARRKQPARYDGAERVASYIDSLL